MPLKTHEHALHLGEPYTIHMNFQQTL